MKSILALSIATILPSTAVSAQYSIEMDGDGILGNGPDYVAAAPSSTVPIDVYVTGQASAVYSANFTIHWIGPGSWIPYAHATGWTTSPDQGTWWPLIQATDFTFTGLVPPFLHGTARFTYDGPVNLVTVSIIAPNGWFDSSYTSGVFTNNTGITFGIGIDDPPTATEESSWSDIKEMFR